MDDVEESSGRPQEEQEMPLRQPTGKQGERATTTTGSTPSKTTTQCDQQHGAQVSSSPEQTPTPTKTPSPTSSTPTSAPTTPATPWAATGSVGSASFTAAADLETTFSASAFHDPFYLEGMEEEEDSSLQAYLCSFLEQNSAHSHLTETRMTTTLEEQLSDEEVEAKLGLPESSLWNQLSSYSPSLGDPWNASSSSSSSTSSCIGKNASHSLYSSEYHRPRQLRLAHPLVMPPKKNRALLWFRKDLRLHDNLALRSLLNDSVWLENMTIIPIYVVHKPVHKRCNATRFQFLLESLVDLQQNLVSKQSDLVVLNGDALQVLPVIFAAWGITHLFFEEFIMPHGVERDFEIRQLAQASGVQVHTVQGVTLFDCKQVLSRNDGQMPSTFDAFVKIISEMPQPSLPLESPQEIGHFQLTKDLLLQELVQFAAHCDGDFNSAVVHIMAGMDRSKMQAQDDVEIEAAKADAIAATTTPFGVPHLQSFGIDPPPVHSFLYGGETRALHQLEHFCNQEKHVASFDKPRTSPIFVTTPSTTCMSAYLNLGCLSPREFFYRVMCIQGKYPDLKGPVEAALDGQLIWRDFFYTFGVGTPGFAFQATNPHCLQIGWRLMQRPQEGEQAEDDTEEKDAEAHLSTSTRSYHRSQRSRSRARCYSPSKKPTSPMSMPPATSLMAADTKLANDQFSCWKEGKTGYPWIDAVMRQLVQEGWAHHLARHSVACFLTRGGLFIAWERGAEFFEEILIDYELAMNTGNWLWVSASSFYQDYRVVHSPTACAQQWDPQGKFIRKYVPALRNLPTRFIFEPWKAPLSVQRASNCLIGKDYPFPIVDFRTSVQRCLSWMDDAYARKQYGTPPATHRSFCSPSSASSSSSSSKSSPNTTEIIPNGLFI